MHRGRMLGQGVAPAHNQMSMTKDGFAIQETPPVTGITPRIQVPCYRALHSYKTMKDTHEMGECRNAKFNIKLRVAKKRERKTHTHTNRAK